MRSSLVGAFSLLASSVFAADAAMQEADKKTVVEFYEAGLNRKDFEAAPKFGLRYIQHTRWRLTASNASRHSSAS